MNQQRTSEQTAPLAEKSTSAARAISAHNLFRGPVYIFGKPVDKDVIFSNHRGVYKKKIEKRQRRLLVKIPFINSFLEEGELIKVIASGYSPFTRLERFVLRYLTVFQRRALFVFTDRRAFYIPTTFTYGYRYSISEIRYANCKNIQIVGGTLLFTFHNGGYEQFPYIGRRERRKMRSFFSSLAFGAAPIGSLTLTYLCARCGAVIPKRSASCPHCRLRFWTADKAGKWSLLIPGGGYFYMGNVLYGVASAALELLLAVLLVLSLHDVYLGFKNSALASILLGVALAGVKTVSFFHSQDLVQGCFPAMGQLPSVK